jgi:hypothetical protein
MKDYDFFNDLLDAQTATRQIAQGSDEWDQIRLGRFTSSEIHKLLTNPRSKADKEAGKFSETALTYINVKVAESITGHKKLDSYAFPLVHGKETEPEAVAYFCEKKGFEHTPIGFIVFGDHAGGSPDGLINETDILEVKCPYALNTHIDYLLLTDQYDLMRLKPEYYFQCQSNLLFSQKEKCHFVSYDARYPEKQRLVHIPIKPVAEHFDMIVKAIEKAVEEKLKLIQILTQ